MNTDVTDKMIEDYGVIAHMALPAGWIEDAHNADDENDILEVRCFRAPEFTEVALYLRFSGRPNDASSRHAWLELMQSGVDEQMYASDIEDIAGIVGDLADKEVFEATDARVRDWNGKHVLFVEGRFKEHGWRSIHLFIDIDGDGMYTQQITFGAPNMVYEAFVQTAVCAMESISWKPPVVKSLPSAD